MVREYKVSFLAFLFSILFFLPHAAHGRLAVHHIHRPPPHNQHFHRQDALLSDLGNHLSSVGSSPDPGGTSSPPLSTNTAGGSNAADSAPATTAPTATSTSSAYNPLHVVSQLSQQSLTPSSSPAPQTSDPPSSSPAASSASSPPLTSNPATSDVTPTPSPAVSSPQSSQPPTSTSTSSAPTPTCPLGVDLLGQCILPPASSNVPSTSVPSSQSQTPTSLASSSGTPILPLSPNNPISSLPLSSNAPTSSDPPSSSAPASSSPPSSDNIPISLPLLSDTPTSSTPPSSKTPVPSESNAPISLSLSSDLPIFSPTLSSNTPNSLPTPSASSPLASSGNPPSLSAAPQTTQQTPSASSPLLDNQSSLPSHSQSSSAPIDPCGPLGLSLGLCTSGTPTSAPIPSSGSISPPAPTLGSSNSVASPSSGSSLPLASTSISRQGSTTSIPGSLSQSASGTAAEPSTTFSGTNSALFNASSSAPVISFPSYTTGPSDQTTGVQSTSTGSSASVLPQNSQFSYVTVTSLLGTSSPSSSMAPTLTDPDAATTTLSLPDSSSSAAGPVPSASLPADLPARIYPADMVNPSALPSENVLCSLLFTSFLPWNFVATHTQSQGQIFSWAPLIISQALNISSTDTPPFALQVFVPVTYQSTEDASMLRTEYLFYLPTNLVSVLANQIKVLSSTFYSISEPYKDLADQVDPAFALTSVANPNVVPGTANNASSQGSNSRTATIIGIVSALGGLALIILGVLIFNAIKRSRQLRHQRLSDPNLPNDPYPDRTGRDFDQDSVGGPRRRSFYFAEDSLRGQPQAAEQSTVPMAQAQTQYIVQPGSQIQYSSRSNPENVRERRAPVVPGAISAPILTQSSLNW